MVPFYNMARAMATWAGLTKEEASPLIRELINNIRPIEVNPNGQMGGRVARHNYVTYYSFNYQEVEPGVKAINVGHRYCTAQNLCSLLQSEGIKAEMYDDERVICFKDYKAPSEEVKSALIAKLKSLDPKNLTLAHVNEVSSKQTKNSV